MTGRALWLALFAFQGNVTRATRRRIKAFSTLLAQARIMVVRTRLRAILYPVLLYALSGVAASYFIYTAVNGERGLKTKAEYKVQIAALRDNLTQLKTERTLWEHRITLMRSEAVDRDLLEEQARLKLDFVDPRDLVVFSKVSAKP
ncbi:septum formation initiator family protein [Lichenihabitans sp. PAMC28606]|uniref:FtsB family cell division protein n=1 Tax=Lichenihabitans sp. PAMC28606 TaxID=2880932 RepID=UPI001D0B8E94|nr:septum formation initiator family protein [Lichenihabitans sp. PAMC28606]UDL95351.1 septum formation initiator family protein [Lichenihabitans sp. PAMC28606]